MMKKLSIALPLLLLSLTVVEAQTVEVSTLTKTDVYSTPDEWIQKDRNYIFCDTFGHAWYELGKMEALHSVSPIEIQGLSDLSDSLNSLDQTFFNNSRPDRLAMAGMKKEGIAQRINAGLRKKFGLGSPKPTFDLRSPNDILAYAFLLKTLKFETPFLDMGDLRLEGGFNVESFGIAFDAGKDLVKLGRQVRVLRGNSIRGVQLLPKDFSETQESILVLNVYDLLEEETLDSVIQKAFVGMDRGEPELFSSYDAGSTLKVPVVDFDLRRNYSEIIGKSIVGSPYLIAKATQDIQFKLNKEGAALKSEARILIAKGSGGPRHLSFRPPFLIVLLNESSGERKYEFAAWIGNEELLAKAEQ